MATTTPTPSKSASPTVVRVGVGVLVRAANKTDEEQGSKVYCGIRKGSHGAGSLALPGGHLELFESWQECATREVKEETNLDLDPSSVTFGHVTNDPMPSEHKHYVTIFMLAETSDMNQLPENLEPHKCEGWKSYSWKELEDHQKEGKLFGPLNRLIQERPPKVLEFLGLKAE